MSKINQIKSTIFSIVPYLVTLLIGLWIYFNYKSLSLDKIWEYPPRLLLIIASIFVVYLIFSGISNLILFKNWKHTVKLFPVIVISLASGTSNYLSPAKLNLPIRLFLQKELLNIPYNVGASTKLVMLLVDTGFIAFLSMFYFLHIDFIKITQSLLLVGFGLIALIVGLNFLSSKILQTKSKFLNKIIQFFHKTFYNLKQLSLPVFVLTFLLAVLRRSLSVLSTFIILSFFTNSISFFEIIIIQSLATFLGIISFMPMGLGVRDLSFIEMLERAGISKDISLVVVVIERFIWTLLPIILGVVSWFYINKTYKINYKNSMKKEV